MPFIEKLKYSKILRFYFFFKKKLIIFVKRILTPFIIKNNFKNIHLGCGGRIFSGWLNADINIYADCYLNLKNKLPFPDESINFIYSEHVIEHFEYIDAKNLLKECYRVLKPAGVIRTAMPDLDFYLEGLNREKTGIDFEIYKEYIKAKMNSFQNLADLPANMNTMLNFSCHCCGCQDRHRYVYQEKTFMALLNQCRFTNSKKVEPGKSDFPELLNLETSLINRPEDIKFHLLETLPIE